MSKVCKNCGFQLQDDALFCFSCGAKQDEVNEPQNVDFNAFSQPETSEPVAQPEPVVPVFDETLNIPFVQPASETPVNNGFEMGYNNPIPENVPVQPAEPPKSKKSKGKGFWIKLICFLLVLVVLAAGVVLYIVDDMNNKNEINEAVNNYVDAVYLGESDLIDDLIPDEYEDELEDQLYEWGLDPESVFETRSASMDTIYGDDITIKYEITDFERVPCFNFYYYVDMLELNHPIQLDDIDNIYRIRFDITIKGSDGKDVIHNKMAAIEIDGEWCLASLNSYYFAFIDAVAPSLSIDDYYNSDYDEEYYY